MAPAYLAPAGAVGPIAPQAVTATSALAIIATIPAGLGPNFQVAVSRDDTVYVAYNHRADQQNGSLFVIRPGSLTLDDTVTGIKNATVVAVDLNDDTVYVGGDGANNFDLSVVDGRTLTVVDTIPLGAEPSGLAVNSSDDTVYVSFGNQLSQNVLRVINGRDTDDSFTVTVDLDPIGIAVDADDDTVYVANSRATGSVSVIRGSTSTVQSTVTGVPRSFEVALSSQGDFLYTSNTLSSSVSVINTSTSVTSTSSLGGTRQPRYMALSPSDDTLYVADSSGESPGPWYFHVMNAQNLDDSFTLNLPTDYGSVGTAVRSDGTVYVSLIPVGGLGPDSRPGRVLALAQVTPTLTTTAGLADDTATITLSVPGGYQAEATTVTTVSFDDTVATGWTRTGPNTWSGPVPAGVGNVPVTMTFNGGRQALAGNFVYSTDPAPTVTGISPASGTVAGSTPVTITGTNLLPMPRLPSVVLRVLARRWSMRPLSPAPPGRGLRARSMWW